MSKVYKIRTDEVEEIKEALMRFIIERKTVMKESDIIHALIKYHLYNLTADEVIKYREEVLGKED